MTSTPVTLLLKRSGNASDRPSGNILVNGELATNFGAADPGVYFENSAGGIVKIGPSSLVPQHLTQSLWDLQVIQSGNNGSIRIRLLTI